MPSPSANADLPSSPPGAAVDALLGRLRQQLHGAIAARVGWQTLAAVSLVGWLALTGDRLLELSPTVRLVGELTLLLLGLGWLAVVAAPRLVCRITDQQVVTLLHRRRPREAALIATSLDLRREPDTHRNHQLADAAIAAADDAAHSIGDAQLVRGGATMGVAWFAVVAATAAVFFAAVRPDLATSFARRVALSEEQWPRRVRLEVDGFTHNTATGEWTRVAPRGEPAEFTVIAEVDPTERPPETLWARGGRLASRHALTTLTRVGAPVIDATVRQRYRRRIERLDNDLSLVVRGGDAKLRLRLIASDRPLLTDLTIQSTPPGYLDQPATSASPTTLAPQPEGSVIQILAGASKQLASVEASLRVAGATAPRPLETRLEDEGRRVIVTAPELAESGVVTLSAVDSEGLASEPIDLPIEIAKDTPPTVAMALAGVGRAITRDARVPVRIRLDDDHGVSQVLLTLRRDEDLVALPVAQPRVTPGSSRGVADLLSLRSADPQQRLDLNPGDRLTLVATATDRYDLTPRPAAESQPIELEVVPPAELLARISDAQRDLRASLEALLADVERLEYEIDLQSRRQSADEPPDAGALRRWAEERLLDCRKAGDGVGEAANRADGLRRQVVNNRLDQPDLVDRLERRVVKPLRRVGEADLAATELALGSLTETPGAVVTALPGVREAKASLEEVLTNLESQQTYNEVVSLLRGLIREQRRVNDQTAREESENVRSLFD